MDVDVGGESEQEPGRNGPLNGHLNGSINGSIFADVSSDVSIPLPTSVSRRKAQGRTDGREGRNEKTSDLNLFNDQHHNHDALAGIRGVSHEDHSFSKNSNSNNVNSNVNGIDDARMPVVDGVRIRNNNPSAAGGEPGRRVGNRHSQRQQVSGVEWNTCM
jgi:hypothetical protein